MTIELRSIVLECDVCHIEITDFGTERDAVEYAKKHEWITYGKNYHVCLACADLEKEKIEQDERRLGL